jgi:3'-phosphoadenosine 5'-phosphosulfate sulfotransferase (PAPS reductase)/FAD synthetase
MRQWISKWRWRVDWRGKIEQAKKPALQFSGGKDSLACLYLLRPYWDRLTVIFANQGDPFPETMSLLEQIKPLVMEFHVAEGNSRHERAYPVDMLPVRNTPLGRVLEPDGAYRPMLQNRNECCWRNFWLPMTRKVRDLGVDLLIRGQRREEELRAPIEEQGSMDPSGAEVILPINDWTTDQVKTFLQECGVPLPRFYETMSCSVDCMCCTAYLKDTRGKVEYLRKYHPEVGLEYERRLRVIGKELQQDIDEMRKSLVEINHA